MKGKIFFVVISVYIIFALQGCVNSVRFAVNKSDHEEYSTNSKSKSEPTKKAEPAKPNSSTVVLETQEGWASYYGGEFHGRKTANGEIFDKNKFTAAHRTLPLGTTARITHVNNKKSVVVRINDRGPFKSGRILDVAHAVAITLDFEKEGLALVRIDVLQYGDNKYYK